MASGGGRSFENFVERSRSGQLRAEVVALGASRASIGAIDRADRLGVPVFVRRKPRKLSSQAYSEGVFEEIRRFQPDYVCLAGFLHLLWIPEDYKLRVLNIHPALIPAFSGQGFYGRHVHEAVYKAGVKVSGCTVHFCDNVYDHGPIILQRPALLSGHEQPEGIARKVFEQELEAYPAALNALAEGRVRVVNGRALIDA